MAVPGEDETFLGIPFVRIHLDEAYMSNSDEVTGEVSEAMLESRRIHERIHQQASRRSVEDRIQHEAHRRFPGSSVAREQWIREEYRSNGISETGRDNDNPWGPLEDNRPFTRRFLPNITQEQSRLAYPAPHFRPRPGYAVNIPEHREYREHWEDLQRRQLNYNQNPVTAPFIEGPIFHDEGLNELYGRSPMDALVEPLVARMAEAMINLQPGSIQMISTPNPESSFFDSLTSPEPEKAKMEEIRDLRTIGQLRKNGYTNLSQELIKDILYVEQLGVTTSNDVTHWEVIQILEPLERGDKRAINKVFFATIEDKKATLGKLDSETFQRIQRSMFDTALRLKERKISELRSNFESSLRDIRQREQNMQVSRKMSRESYDRLRELENLTPDSTMVEFQKILENSFFTFTKFAFNKAYFSTSNDVVMTYVNAAQNIRIQFNFGKLEIILDISDGHIIAAPLENNFILTNGRYFHPFISNGGSICFGNAADSVAKLLAQAKYGDVFAILASLLTTYDPGANPYVGLPSFKTAEDNPQAKLGMRVASQVSKCPGCTRPVEACVCNRCEECDSREHSTENCPDAEPVCGNCDETEENCGCSEDDRSF